ncbi:hypothetical protein ABIA60_000797 [Pseudomonas frederiksbergensis]
MLCYACTNHNFIWCRLVVVRQLASGDLQVLNGNLLTVLDQRIGGVADRPLLGRLLPFTTLAESSRLGV